DGEVVSEAGPLPAALVRIKGARAQTRSDPRGRFHLPPEALGRRVTAWKEGFFIAGGRATQSPLRLRLMPLPTADHEEYEWVSPVPKAEAEPRCGNCHRAIYREWAGSGHARSATGRPFRDLYDDLLRDKPLGGDVCASCHAPTAAGGEVREVQGTAAL